jgi:predicted transcriptional regulator
MPDEEASRPIDRLYLAAKIVAAYFRRNHLDANGIAPLIADVRSTLAQLGILPHQRPNEPRPIPCAGRWPAITSSVLNAAGQGAYCADTSGSATV